MKKFIALLLAVMLVFSLAACQKDEPSVETPTSGGGSGQAETTAPEDNKPAAADRPFIVQSADFSGDFHNGWTNATYDRRIRDLVWEFGLLTSTPEGNIIDSPLVESKTVSEDLSEWTFKLNKGVTFSNGEELTPSDVKFTYEFYMDTDALKAVKGTSTLHTYIESITTNEEEMTITFKLKQIPYSVDTSVFMVYIFPEETYTNGANEAGQNVHEYVKANIDNPIGYGPYKIVDYKESEYVKLETVDSYVGDKPKINTIIVKHTPQETALDQLLQGEIDLIPQEVEADKIDAVKASDTMTYSDYFRHGGGTIVMHTDYEAFALTEVRQAFAFVLNRPKIIELFLGKYGIASNGPYSKNHWMMYDDDEQDLLGKPDLGRFEQTLTNYDIVDADGKFDEDANIAKAHELLDIAVAKTDGEYANLTGDAESGYMWKGEPLTIRITYTDFWSDTYNLVWTDEYIAKLGFDVTLHPLEWTIMFGHWTGASEEERQYHCFVGGMGYGLKENPRQEYHSDKIMEWGIRSPNAPRFTGGNSMTTEEWDKLLIDIESLHPVDGREEYRTKWRQFVKVFNEELPIVPVYSNHYHDLYNKDLKNFKTNALWDWPKAILDAYWAE